MKLPCAQRVEAAVAIDRWKIGSGRMLLHADRANEDRAGSGTPKCPSSHSAIRSNLPVQCATFLLVYQWQREPPCGPGLSEPVVEFKWLEAKPVGNDVVVFHLEDGATVKVRVILDRAGVAMSTKNPDGSDLYNFNANLQMTIVPPSKKFTIPKSQLQVPAKPKPPDVRQIS